MRAGRHVIERRRHGVTAKVKGAAHDMVTEIDAEAESLIREMLTGRHRRRRGVRHQRVRRHPVVRGSDRRHVQLRPGVPLFAVSIGVQIGERIIGGAVYDPVRDELFTAVNDELRLNGGLLGVDSPAPSAFGSPVRPTAATAPDSLPMVLTDIPTAGLRDAAEFELFADLLETTDLRQDRLVGPGSGLGGLRPGRCHRQCRRVRLGRRGGPGAGGRGRRWIRRCAGRAGHPSGARDSSPGGRGFAERARIAAGLGDLRPPVSGTRQPSSEPGCTGALMRL